MRGSIKSKTASLELRIEAAEMLTTRPAISDPTLRAYKHAGLVLGCFVCESPHPSPDAIQQCLLDKGLPEDEAARYACMTYRKAYSEVMGAIDLAK